MLLFQRGEDEPDEQEVALGFDTHCLVTADQGTAYGCVREVSLTGNVLRVSLDPSSLPGTAGGGDRGNTRSAGRGRGTLPRDPAAGPRIRSPRCPTGPSRDLTRLSVDRPTTACPHAVHRAERRDAGTGHGRAAARRDGAPHRHLDQEPRTRRNRLDQAQHAALAELGVDWAQ
ncbi:hypothetical protein [Streptomyces yangpuensis]|uniref:hypothetical protein n=1 Tax=Streptomyces yangpuensis TaxID=1648182 RepID=UPI003649A1A5